MKKKKIFTITITIILLISVFITYDFVKNLSNNEDIEIKEGSFRVAFKINNLINNDLLTNEEQEIPYIKNAIIYALVNEKNQFIDTYDDNLNRILIAIYDEVEAYVILQSLDTDNHKIEIKKTKSKDNQMINHKILGRLKETYRILEKEDELIKKVK